MELGKIEKPEVSAYTQKRKLYVVPTLPFEELKAQFNLDTAKIERFWGEVREKIEYFISTYGDITAVYLEGIHENESAGMDIIEKSGKDSNYYKLIKSLVDRGAELRGIEKEEYLRRSKLLFDEYSRSFIPEIKELYEGFFGKDIDFDRWREYLSQKIQETQDDMNRRILGIIEETLGDTGNGVLFITDGRQIEFPENIDVFQIRPPAFDDIVRKMRDKFS